MNPTAHAAPDAHHADEHHVNYMAKAYWLTGLTIVEVLIAWKVTGEGTMGLRLGALTVFSMWKAGIVGAYYMHLKSEPRALKMVALFPLALVVILCLGVLTDGHWLGYAAVR
jgi:cytochrome c oxidase subunit IV